MKNKAEKRIQPLQIVLAALALPLIVCIVLYGRSGLNAPWLNILLPTLLHIDLCAALLLGIYKREEN